MIRQILLCAILCVAVGVTSCAGERSYFSFCEQAFCARIGGSINGVKFEAEVRADGEGRTVCYRGGDALEGLTVTIDNEGEVSVWMGEIEAAMECEAAEGLLQPILLLTAYESSVESVRKEQENTILKTREGCELVLGKDGLPVSVKGERISFAVLSWTLIEETETEAIQKPPRWRSATQFAEKTRKKL